MSVKGRASLLARQQLAYFLLDRRTVLAGRRAASADLTAIEN
jgi:hypothetical protein